jgi:hypothetical protein
VWRHDLDVERVIAAVDVVLDAHVRELNVALVVTRQVLGTWRWLRTRDGLKGVVAP